MGGDRQKKKKEEGGRQTEKRRSLNPTRRGRNKTSIRMESLPGGEPIGERKRFLNLFGVIPGTAQERSGARIQRDRRER